MNAETPSTIRAGEWTEMQPGYMLNCYGDLVRTDLVQPRLRLENQTVQLLLGRAERLHETMAAMKRDALADIDSFLDILATQYRAKRRGQRGGVELTTFDGLGRVQISVADSIEFGAEISAAKDLIDECISKWSTGANSNLRTVVTSAFKTGRTGKIATDRVLSLRRLKIDDPHWQRAMLALDDAMRVVASISYVRFYTREKPDGAWVQITLDFAGV